MANLPESGTAMKLWLALWLLILAPCLAVAGPSAEMDFRAAQEKYGAGEHKQAAALLIRAVKQGHEAAQLPLAAMYRFGQGVKQYYAEARRLFTRAALQGYPSAGYALGMMYRLGEGTQTNCPEAMKWFARAAAGHAEAQNSIGVMYETGRGVKSSYVTAVMWYQVAESKGSRRGRDNLNRTSKKMAAAEVAQAKMLADACERSRYTRCGQSVIR